MRKFAGEIGVNLVGCRVRFEFEADDDATDDEIEAAAKEAAFDNIDWSYDEVSATKR